ncbi:MAG: preprotein translocase subunit SecE [Vicinamibacterales bacterium]
MSTIEQAKSASVRSTEGASEGVKGWWNGGRAFLVEVRNEMRRVTWPARREVYATTVVVILTSTFFGLYLWGLDLAFDRMVNWFFRQFGGA